MEIRIFKKIRSFYFTGVFNKNLKISTCDALGRNIYIIAIVFALFFFGFNVATQAQNVSFSSPDGSVNVSVTFSGGALTYVVKKGSTTIIANSPLGINTNVADFTSGLSYISSSSTTINETYTLPTGKRSTYVNNASERTIKVSKNQKELSVTLRAYNDGVAFRYSIPGSGNLTISSESTGFKLAGLTAIYTQSHPNKSGYESPLSRITTFLNQNWSAPVLGELSNNNWVLLTSAANYGSYCVPHFACDNTGLFKTIFPNNQTTVISTTLPFDSPWKVAILSAGNLSKIVESNIMENLNLPTEPGLKNASWIIPGQSTWNWLTAEAGASLDVQKGYVDLAQEMGWKYHLLDDGWERSSYVPSLISYATPKSIGVLLWTNVTGVDTEAEMDSKFSLWAGWGVKGVKIDFFDHLPSGGASDDYEDTQARMKLVDLLLTKAAQYKLMVVFHGCTLPYGERRRWPNLMSREGARGEELSPTALHNCILPFGRNAIGPLDYTPVRYSRTSVSYGHHTALAVLYESGLLIYSDRAANYQASVAKDFLKKVPAAWDDTRFIEGYPSQYATIARRKGNDWFIGAIANGARTAQIPLSFLNAGLKYTANIYKDGANNTMLVYEKQSVTNTATLNIPLIRSGGAAVYITLEGNSSSSLEAESSTLSGTARIVACSSCSNGSKVGQVGQGEVNGIQFNNVNVTASGKYKLTITYCSGQARNAQVGVNTASPVTLSFPSTGSFNTPGEQTLEVNLNSGSNSVKIYNASAWAPDFDKIAVGVIALDPANAITQRIADLESEAEESSQLLEGIIFPNPVRDKLTIKLINGFEKGANLNLYNNNSELIFSKKVKGKEYIMDISTTSSGVYFVKISNHSKKITLKVIKK